MDRIRRRVRERERNRFYTLKIAYLGLWSTNDQTLRMLSIYASGLIK